MEAGRHTGPMAVLDHARHQEIGNSDLNGFLFEHHARRSSVSECPRCEQADFQPRLASSPLSLFGWGIHQGGGEGIAVIVASRPNGRSPVRPQCLRLRR